MVSASGFEHLRARCNEMMANQVSRAQSAAHTFLPIDMIEDLGGLTPMEMQAQSRQNQFDAHVTSR